MRDAHIAEMCNEVSAENLKKIVYQLAGFGTRHSLSDIKSSTQGIGAARNWVKSEFERYAKNAEGRLSVSLDAFTVEPDGKRIIQKTEMMNVMATLKGTDPRDNRILIISGHLDSRASDVMDSAIKAPGANDDASGVAAVMELARIMSQRKFPCTIIFVAVVGEEQGLYGSKHLAERAKKENWNIVAMLNNDMIGNSSSDETNLLNNMQVRVFSEGVPLSETTEMAQLRQRLNAENDSKSRQLARYVKEIGETYVDQIEVKLVYRNDRFLRGGDHTPFAQQGFTAVRLCEMNENYQRQHQNVRMEKNIQYGDLPEFVDYEYLRKNAAINLAVLANLALAPDSPESAGVVIAELTNKTTLKWQSSVLGKKPYGYYVLMRETTSAVWEKKFFTKENSLTLNYSKDNYFFAVQAVDEEGHTSLPVFPVPVR